VYEPPDDSDALLRFFSESVSFWTGGGDVDKLWDLATFRRESLRGGDFDILIDLCFPSSRFRVDCLGGGDRDKFVDIVETDADEADRIRFDAPLSSGSSLALSRFRPLSSSAFASCSSAMPFLIGLSVEEAGEIRSMVGEEHVKRPAQSTKPDGTVKLSRTFLGGPEEHHSSASEPASGLAIVAF
jgi:hypothetical protein